MNMRAANIEVPASVVRKWQEIVDLLAAILKVPAALIMKVEPPHISVFVASDSPGNPYHPREKACLDTGLYCETVMSTRESLLVPDALADEAWRSNPDVKLGLISYLGFPILRPDGEVFGTLCVLDDRRNDYNAPHQSLLRQFRDVLQADLKALFELDARLAEEARAADVLRRANERLELAVGGSHVGVWESATPRGDARDARQHYVNFWEQLGHEGRPAGGATALDEVHPDERARVEEMVRRYLAGETAEFETEVRFRHTDGSYRTMLARGAAVRDAAGRPIRLVGVTVDITKLKHAEEALAQERYLLATLMDNLPDNVYFKDAAGRFVRINKALTTYFGLGDPAEAVGRTDFDFFAEEHARAAYEDEQEILRTGRPLAGKEEKETWLDGRVRWVSSTKMPFRDEDGTIVGTFGVSRDIPNLKVAEEALTERARLASLSADVGVALTGADTLSGILRPCAEALVRHLGAAFARVWTLNEAENVLELQASAGMYTHTDGPHSRVPVGRLKIGRIAEERRPHLTNDVPNDPRVSDPGWARREGMAAFAGHPLVVQDQVGRRHGPVRAPAALRRDPEGAGRGGRRDRPGRRARPAQGGPGAGQGSGGGGEPGQGRVPGQRQPRDPHPHERHPRHDRAGPRHPLTDDQRQSLTTVKSAADNLLGLLNDLLDFAKIEAGKLELDPADFSLRAAVGDTVRALAARAHAKGLELIYHVRPDVPDALVGDTGRLRQVLLNLVGNALKFTEQGEVEVRVEIAGDLAPEEAGLRFTVRDTGIGIPRDKQERIFRAFEQEDASTTRKYGGTGLGLTISAQLAALMGGTITVDSEPGRGSTFALTARFGRRPQRPEQLAVRPPALLDNLRVLVVDDNATNRHILGEWLRGWRTEPAAVGDGLAALDALWVAVRAGRPYALVLLDARMPDADGLTLAARIRKRAELAATRIILLTSGDRPGDWARYRELRVNARLLKPVQQDELLETIHRVMSRSDGAAPPAAGPAREQEQARASAPVAPPLRVLAAEDNEFNAQLLEQLLTRRGHCVRLVDNGRETLRLAAEGDFDLLLLDVHMPELDGFQVVQAVRERERTTGGHLPIIALTARSRQEDRERCLAAGMDDFLAKPIRAPDLWAAIDRVVAARPPVAAWSGDPGATGGPRLLDPQVLLAACGDDAATLEMICRTFRARLPDQLQAVQDALRDRNAPRLREAAHKLSGMVAAFSTGAGGVASDLEDRAAQGRLEEARPLAARLEAMAEGLMRLVGGLSFEALRDQARGAAGPGRTAGT